MSGMGREWLFGLVAGTANRATVWRDKAKGWFREVDCGSSGGVDVSRHWIESGRGRIDGILVKPAGVEAKTAVLICHGIGEAVEHWHGVQRMLAAEGAASLVFDYVGYGRSRGRATSRQCERDAVAAFEFLEKMVPGREIAVLGFSMGSGVALGILDRVKPGALVLAGSFTSFEAAAISIGFPRQLRFLVPKIWRNDEALKAWARPLTIVHGDRDELFPVEMAQRLADGCGELAELIVVPGVGHAQPIYAPESSYWRMILSKMERGLAAGVAIEEPLAVGAGGR